MFLLGFDFISIQEVPKTKVWTSKVDSRPQTHQKHNLFLIVVSIPGPMRKPWGSHRVPKKKEEEVF